MLIGILSDTHDRVEAAAAAMRLLRGQNCEFFIHCGDVGNEHVLDCLGGEPAAFVWGNNDFGEPDLVRYAESRGHEFDYVAPNAYQYRVYVIRAFNTDVPYDQFVTEHLAGDLLARPRSSGRASPCR